MYTLSLHDALPISVTTNGYLACTTPQQALGPLSGAAKYPAGARPSKCIIIIIIIISAEINGREGNPLKREG
jgi:hypothetical protein